MNNLLTEKCLICNFVLTKKKIIDSFIEDLVFSVVPDMLILFNL